MDEFCGSEFWDPDITWFTTNPDFTPCFQKTVLVWIPCGFLWLFAASDVYYSVTAKARAVPWSSLSVGKYIVTLALMLLDVIRLGYWVSGGDGGDVPEVEVYAPLEKIATYLLYLILLHYSRYKGVQSSGVQFLFWLLLTLCEAFPFRTVITHSPKGGENPSMSIVQIIYFPLVVANFLLNCWADVRPLYEQSAKLKDRPCPEHGSSYLSRITFSWFDRMAWQGWRRPLVNNDLWSLNSEDASRTIVPIFDHHWSKRVGSSRKASGSKAKKGGYTVPPENISSKGAKEPTSILPVLLRSFGGTFFFGASLKIIPDMLAFVSPQILNLLINFTSSNEETWKGYLYAVVLFFSAFFQTMVTAQYTHRMYLTAMRVRTVLVSAIYRKALLMSNAAKKESTVGEIVNLMSVDVQRIMDTLPFINLLWSAPLQIGVAVYFLWQELGPASLAGLAVMVLLIPVNAVIAGKVRQLQLSQLKHKDKRVKMMNEILSGVKVLKLYAWEPSFEDQVLAIRAKEMETLKSAAYLNAVTNFLWTCAPFLVSVSTFATYVLMDSENVLDPQKAFVSLSLFNIMNLPLTMLPMIIIFVVQSVVSINRINGYMNKEEIDPEAVEHNPNEGEPLLIENGTFAWESETTVLRNINFRVKEGSLVAVVGSVGAGKSSLLSALLGELEKSSGRVNTRGSVGYVAQQAWIQNATLRDNILFGKHYDPARYDKIISACALKPDLDILPGRDRTEIGEKGINLSGGQKQRISLARSVYNNADVYLFDDPLSAVDSHVGKHIFDKVLGPKGLLKKKTRVLVTHGISFLPQCDNIFVLKDGEVSEVGSYQELLDKKGAFAEFLSQHVTPEDIDEDPNLAKDLESVVGNVEELRRRRMSREASRGPDSESEAEGSRKRRHASGSSKMGASVESLHKLGDNKTDLIEKEKAETESVKLAVYVDYFRAAGWSMTISTFVLYMLFQVCAVGSNLWLSEWSQEPVVNGTTDPGRRDMYLGVYAGLGITQALFIFAGTMVMALATLKSSQVFHVSMLNRIMRSPMSFFDTTPIGRIVNRFAKDIDVADNTLPFNIRLWLNGFFQVAATLAVISYSTPIFLVVIVPIGIVYYLVQKIYVSSSRQLKRMESVTRSPIYSHFGETISGAPTIRAYSQQERFILESELRVDNNQVSYFPSIVANRWLAVRLETVGNLVIFFAAVFAVVSKDTLDPGIVGLSVSYALQITMSLMMLVRWTSDVETNIVAIERLQEYVEAPQEAPWNIPEKKPPTTWPHQGVVEFEKYQTRYRPGLELVLKDVTCKIDGGEKIGIVGRTGAGKSSLTLALFRIVEAAGGHIKIDGQNIANLGLHDVRGRITIIPQDPVLFSGTLRVNLDPFNKYQDATIWKALELAHLKVFVKGLSAGLEHEISEGGENLSVGQRQLVCLARALLRKTKILVLDEATAAVDLETDDLIQKTIRQEFADSTVITIAHRLNTIMDSTRVMVLDQGRIAEFDAPDALVQDSNSIFHSMAKDANLT